MKIEAVQRSGSASLTGWDINNNAGLPQEGSAIWTCIGHKETEGVERPDYANPEKMVSQDVLRYLFARLDENGKPTYAMTKEFKQSSFHKSALMQFLTSWIGKSPPSDGSFGTEDMIGKGAQLTISHLETRKGTKYAAITGVSPVLADYQDKVIPHTEFDIPKSDNSNLPY